MNVGIILSAGTSSRFKNKLKQYKQLFCIEDIPVIQYSITIMVNTLDKIIIVTNSKCYNEIINMVKNNENIIVVINDINCRLESIGKALDYINNNMENIKNVIIHDSARPFITEKHINKVLEANKKTFYSHYYLKLVNGLAKKNDRKYEIMNRDDFIELCTPICINYPIFNLIYKNYISKENRIFNEFIPALDLLNIKYKLIEGKLKHLRKITTIDDIF